MNNKEDLLTLRQVAERLQLHVKTVRNYVRDGRLQATRIGKQYRISSADLAEFSGHAAVPSTAAPITHNQTDVSAVVDVHAISPATASRLTNTLLAAIKGAPDHPSRQRVDTIYYEESGRLKLILHGSTGFVADLLGMIETLTNQREGAQ